MQKSGDAFVRQRTCNHTILEHDAMGSAKSIDGVILLPLCISFGHHTKASLVLA